MVHHTVFGLLPRVVFTLAIYHNFAGGFFFLCIVRTRNFVLYVIIFGARFFDHVLLPHAPLTFGLFHPLLDPLLLFAPLLFGPRLGLLPLLSA